MSALAIATMVGLRDEVGADWISYMQMLAGAGRSSFGRALEIGDPGYQLINWMAYQLGGGIYLVNIICATLFVWGLFRLAGTQPRPWLALLVAVPYLIIVVAMGYTRQAVALGILMAGLANFVRGGSTIRILLYVAVAALFHRTAVIAFCLVALASERSRFINVLIAIAASYFLYDIFISGEINGLVERYIEAKYSSQGAAIRIAMNMFAAVLFWLAGSRMEFSERERRLWQNYSLAAAGLLFLLLVLPSSTAVDRMALYILPLQLVVLSRLPLAIGQFTGKIAVAGYLLLVQFVWLNFSQYARYWVPYQWVLS
ncbi:EpsG family protein [Sphingomonas lutea]|uniref:EpsG family protein n=1 Tax=Sphingomonas lutea TaxID=1045317 RepID=UPI001F403297|nr:EpsG family protein [Sphingomonas lutea]